MSVFLTTPSLPDRAGCQKLHLRTAFVWLTAAICNLNLNCAHLCSLTDVLLECVPPDGIIFSLPICYQASAPKLRICSVISEMKYFVTVSQKLN